MKMLRIKICGITNKKDALKAVELGADALGFVFYRKSPRHISPEDAKAIIAELPPFVSTVGVFVNEPVRKVVRMMKESGVQIAQLHGDETPDYCARIPRAIKAIRVKDSADLSRMKDYKVSAFLLDTHTDESPGGTGKCFDWAIATEAASKARVMLAGGLTPENVSEAVKLVRPYGVDVSSGVEKSKGKKDYEKLALFIKRARGAE